MNFDALAGACAVLDVCVLMGALAKIVDVSPVRSADFVSACTRIRDQARASFEEAARALVENPKNARGIARLPLVGNLLTETFPQYKKAPLPTDKLIQSWSDETPLSVDPEEPAGWPSELIGDTDTHAITKRATRRMHREAVSELRVVAAELRGHAANDADASAASTGSWLL